jgi:hypothetical protein
LTLDHADAARVARLARFCAALYRAVPLEGHGLVGEAEELAHAAELESAAEADDVDVVLAALTPRDIQVACQLLIDVRREPRRLSDEEVALARRFFPEVEADTLDPLERLVYFYTVLIQTP